MQQQANQMMQNPEMMRQLMDSPVMQVKMFSFDNLQKYSGMQEKGFLTSAYIRERL